MFYLLDNAYHELPEGEELPKGAVKVPRLPSIGESWSGKKFTKDDEIIADLTVPARHKEDVHYAKMIEASLILSGIKLTHGFLAEEAKALNLNIETLASTVYSKYQDLRKAELNRRLIKKTAREKK